VKGRPRNNPLIVHVASKGDAKKYVREFPPLAEELAIQFWPGPLTMILPKNNKIPNVVTAGNDSVALRVPDHPMTLMLLRALDFPLAAPSANPFNYVSPTQAKHVQQQLGDKIPYILDGGPCRKGIESTIISFREGKPVILRAGAVTREEIEEVIGEKVAMELKPSQKPIAPGMMEKHYSPHTRLLLTDDIGQMLPYLEEYKVGILSLQDWYEGIEDENHRILSEEGNLEEAAANLYEAMIELDQLGLDVIVAERLPEEGLGVAINDRLTKASQKKN
jgi:L-threonylcarbamoyladenylate synthase